jgi:hypothetical protein
MTPENTSRSRRTVEDVAGGGARPEVCVTLTLVLLVQTKVVDRGGSRGWRREGQAGRKARREQDERGVTTSQERT